MRKALVALSLLAPLAGCAAGSGAAPAASTARTDPTGFRAPQVQRLAGIEGVIGSRADALIASLGKPRIDLSEGDARKLQFAGDECVFDIFLYPMHAGEEPVATHVEARRRRDGRDVDKAHCLGEIIGR